MSLLIFQELRSLFLRRLEHELRLVEQLQSVLQEGGQVYYDAMKQRASKVTEEVFSLFVKRVSPEIQPEAIGLLFQYFDADADAAVSPKELTEGLRLGSDFSFTENPRHSNLPVKSRRSDSADVGSQLGLAFMAILAHLSAVESDRTRFYNLPGFSLGRLFSELAAGKNQLQPEDLRRLLGCEQLRAAGLKDPSLKLFDILQAGSGRAGMRAFRRLVTPQHLNCELLLSSLPLDLAAQDSQFATPLHHKTIPADLEDHKKESQQLFDSFQPNSEEEDYRLIEALRASKSLSSREDASSPYINLQDKFVRSHEDQFRSPPRDPLQTEAEPPRLLKRKHQTDSAGLQADEESLQESFALLGPALGSDRVQEFADYPHSAQLVASQEFQTPQLKASAVGYSFFDAPQKDPLGREALKPSEQSAKAVTKRLEFRSNGSLASWQAPNRPTASFQSNDASTPDRFSLQPLPERLAAGSTSKPFESSGSLRVRFAATPTADTHQKRSLLKHSLLGTAKHHHTHSTGLKEASDWKSTVRRDKTGSPTRQPRRPARTSQAYKEVQRQIRFEELF